MKDENDRSEVTLGKEFKRRRHPLGIAVLILLIVAIILAVADICVSAGYREKTTDRVTIEVTENGSSWVYYGITNNSNKDIYRLEFETEVYNGSNVKMAEFSAFVGSKEKDSSNFLLGGKETTELSLSVSGGSTYNSDIYTAVYYAKSFECRPTAIYYTNGKKWTA